MVTKIHNNDLQEAKGSKVAVVDFSAQWCGPCNMLAPIMEELSEELEGKAPVFGVDVDENPALAQEYRIMNIPAVAILKDGQMVDMSVGFKPKAAMQEWIEKYL